MGGFRWRRNERTIPRRAGIRTASRAAAALAACLALPSAPAAAGCPDLALILAVDTSGSIDISEFRLQVRGFAAAFRDPAVVAALKTAGVVDVGAVFWGDPLYPHAMPLQRIVRGAGAEALAARLEAEARPAGGETGLGAGLLAALDMIEAGAVCAGRKVVNLSGDGRASGGRFGEGPVVVASARARADAAGVTINGLAISDVEPDLADYYRAEVATGPGAFVMEVATHADFAAAIARKLAREIAPAMVATRTP